MEKLNSEGYSDLSPDTVTFNTVMKALATCGESGASHKANQSLQRMEKSYEQGDTRLKPDLLTYNTGQSALPFLRPLPLFINLTHFVTIQF